MYVRMCLRERFRRIGKMYGMHVEEHVALVVICDECDQVYMPCQT